jgi:hypothetical protein
MLFAVMLWLTPYWLTSFVRLGDSAWHVGVAMNIPQVLDGEQTVFSNYGWDYPGSFIYHYSFVKILGIQPLTYIHLYPLLCALLFVILCYALVAKLFDSKVALLSMLMAIPGLHYLQLHPSPHAISALLMLTTLLLLTQRAAAVKVIPLAVILIGIIIFTHPTTPLLLTIFLAAAFLVSVVYFRRISSAQVALAAMLIICLGGWFIWNSFYPSHGMSAATIYEGMMPDGFSVGTGYLSGTRFVYSDIYNLNKGIYFLYAAVAALAILYIFARTYLEKRSVGKWICGLGGLNRIEALLALSVLPLLLLSFLLAENAHDLIETGLTYIILALSGVIASVVLRARLVSKKVAPYLIMIGALILTLSFPVVAYSIDAYSSYPRSEEKGLEFLASEELLEGKTVVGSNLHQLSFYPQANLEQTEYLRFDSAQGVGPDVVVFRKSGYYYSVMRINLSFERNRYTEYKDKIEAEQYDRVYSSPTFEVYLKGMVEQ